MLLISWNINGLRANLNRELPGLLANSQPDVLCLQETKAWAVDLPDMGWAQGYHAYWGEAIKKGYSGVLTLSKAKPKQCILGAGIPGPDDEGRVVSCEYPSFWLVNVYTPNSKSGLERLEERTQYWDPQFLAFIKSLEKMKPVVVCGDFNVAHKAIDLARPKGNERSAGFTIEERVAFEQYIRQGFIDTFREFESGPGHYTWWSLRSGARKNNVGWRIDYFLISRKLRPKLKRAFILPEVLGSDHCPVGIELA
jgi:exodeoxyribonuclease-3